MAVWREVAAGRELCFKQVVTFPSYLLLHNVASERGEGGSGDSVRECNANGHCSALKERWDWLQAISDPCKVIFTKSLMNTR
jgi:hypothetical protein